MDNKLTLSGHTDAAACSSGERGYSNWELSADRANAARRELIAGGTMESKMLRVVRLAPPVPAPPVVPKVPDFRPALVLPPPPGAVATGQR